MLDHAEPRYEHDDCNGCQFLGRCNGKDLWYHQSDVTLLCSVIARSSSEPSDYISGLAFVGTDADLTEAYHRAMAAGLVTGEVGAYVLSVVRGRVV